MRKAAILTIGDELMIGQKIDSNSAWIASWMDRNGWHVTRKMGVRDDITSIMEGIDLCFSVADLLVTTGGLGPTKDDLTKEALCKYYQCDTVWHEESWLRVQEIQKRFKREITALHRQQCFMPSLATIVANDQGSAPGMLILQEDKILVSVPGVPHEMRHLLSEKIVHLIPKGDPIDHRIIRTCGEGETIIASMISDIEDSLPEEITIAYLPSFNQVTLRLSTYSHEKNEVMDALEETIIARLGNLVYATGDITLPSAIGQLLRARNETIATGESCTGGYLSHLLTSVSGASDYFIGSIVPYAYEMKTSELDISRETLLSFGAVSEEVVTAMAEGVRNKLKVTWALASSGIAGPTGGTPEKPVGTIWIACAGPNGTKARLLRISRDRLSNIEYTAIAALVLLRSCILELSTE